MDPVFKPGGGPDASPPLPKIVVGKKLSRRRKGINPIHLALLAVEEARKQFQQQARSKRSTPPPSKSRCHDNARP